MKKIFVATVIVLCIFSVTINAEATDKQVIAGGGPSTVIVQLFVEEFGNLPAVNGYEFEVPPKSSKHAGGIRCSGKNLFGRTGRPLSVKEKNLNKEDIFLARVPIAFVVGSDAGVTTLTLKQLEGIFRGTITNWSEVGGADADIFVIGREPTEALFSALKKEYPFFKESLFTTVVYRDDNVLTILKNSPKGKYAIGFGAKPNFKDLIISDVEGFSAGVSLGLVYDLKNKDHPVVKAAMEFSQSEEWAEKVKTTGSLPPR